MCTNCHNQNYVDAFYLQYDGLIELYEDKFAKPGLELMELAKPLMKPVAFGNKIDWTWFELWHHEGRRARHGASMMGPDITHWHGTYEVAKHFYSKLLPELEELIEKGRASGDDEKAKAADILEAKIEEVLGSNNHRWFNGEMSDEEKAERQKRMEEFKDRYK